MVTEDMEGCRDFCATVRTSVDMGDEWARKKGDEWDRTKSVFWLVREAVNESRVYLKGNARELGMQVHSRLFDVDEGVWPVSRYLRSVRTHWEKPWRLPKGRYLARPGTSGNVELLMGEYVNCIAMSDDGSTLAMGLGEQVRVMDIESRSMLWLVDRAKVERPGGWPDEAAFSRGSGASSWWVLRNCSHHGVWEGPTGEHVLAMLAQIFEVSSKRVSFEAGVLGDADGECGCTVVTLSKHTKR